VAKFAGDAYSLATRAVKGVNHVLKLINIETKYYETWASALQFSNAAGYTYLSGLTQGTDISNRVGDSVKLQQLDFNFSLNVTVGSTTQGFMRIVLFRDLENQGATPSGAGPLSSSGGSFWLAPPDYINRNRYSILYDEAVLQLPPTYDGVCKRVSIPHNGHVKYRGTGSTSASAAEGAIFLMIWASNTSNLPSIDYWFRMTFTDD